MKRQKPLTIITAICAVLSISFVSYSDGESKKFQIDLNALLGPDSDPNYKASSYIKPYVDFFGQVFDVMDKEYYMPVSKEEYAKFIDDYSLKVISRLKDKDAVIPEVKYLGAGLLVKKLKSPEDVFSNFIPPKEAEEFKSAALGYEQGIGITGHITSEGYAIDKVELRSDSYQKGIRQGDIIQKIDNKDVLKLTPDELKIALFPALGTVISLDIFSKEQNSTTNYKIQVIEFFKETLSSYPTGIPGLFYLKINQFNQKTHEDMAVILPFFERQGMKQLIIDLRGNGGGPPLSAREIANYFIDPNTELFYFQRKNKPPIHLKTAFNRVHFGGEIAILIDKGSGSASELFAGTLRSYKRAILIGTERSAGKTFLKSMFPFEDKSMLYLITSAAYMYDGTRYDPAGLKPDFIAPENSDMFKFVSKCLQPHEK